MPSNNNSEYQRPDPEMLLKRIQREESAKGKLTVFLGAAAGVGKTFAMLDAAHERVSEGVQVLIGWVETHGRKDTQNQVEGLEIIPPKIIEYKGKSLSEMDVDKILQLRPQLVLVDELAHTNVPGSRHQRRFMDVEEILDAGIDVYTTLNIQHIESLNDVVSKITGITVHETVPDYIIENTDSIKLVDIAPEELIKRLRQGKVYMSEQAERALKNFFRFGNLSALRELSLRFTALKVDKEMSGYMQEHDIKGPWQASDKVMVCVSTNPACPTLVRSARRLSRGLKAEFIALHIESPDDPMDLKKQAALSRSMSLASELGSSNIITQGRSVASRILEVARENNVTHIVVGKTRKSRLQLLLRDSIVDQIIHESGDLNIHVIEIPKTSKSKKREVVSARRDAGIAVKIAPFVLSGLLTAIITVTGLVFRNHLELINIGMLYVLPTLISAYMWGKKASYFAAIASVVCFDFMFIPPTLSFTVSDIKYIWSFAVLLIISFVVGRLSDSLKKEARAAINSARRMSMLYDFSRDIAGIINLEVIVAKMAIKASQNLDRKVTIIVPDESGDLREWITMSPGENFNQADLGKMIDRKNLTDTREHGVAKWAFEHKMQAGRTTDTLPGSKWLYVPLTAGGGAHGIMAINIEEKQIPVDQKMLIDLWAKLGGIAIERSKLETQAQESSMMIESEKLRNALFNSISHELKTPLASVKGAVSTLAYSDMDFSENVRKMLYESIYEGVLDMERITGNLLDSARMESGSVALKKEWVDVEDIIGTAIRRSARLVSSDSINTRIDKDIPLISADGVLIEQVVVNLIENAVKYGKTPIDIDAYMESEDICIIVSDTGLGVSDENLDKIFDKFFTLKSSARKDGLGLGLSICKSIITAHRGTIEAYNKASGGFAIRMRLPVEGSPAGLENATGNEGA